MDTLSAIPHPELIYTPSADLIPHGVQSIVELCHHLVEYGIAHPYTLALDLTHCREAVIDWTIQGVVYAFPNLRVLILNGCTHITNECMVHIAQLPHLTGLCLRGCFMVCWGLDSLEYMGNLTALDLSGLNMAENRIKVIKKLTRLTNLNLSYCSGLTCTSLAGLAGVVPFTTLSLCKMRGVNNATLKRIATITTLTTINLSYNSRVTDTGLAYLRSMPLLANLNISQCDKITDLGVGMFTGTSPIANVNVQYCRQISAELRSRLAYAPITA